MIRILLILVMLAGTAGAVVAYGDPDKIARASDSVSHMLRQRSQSAPPAVQIPRGQGGEFALQAKINGVTAPMVIDTGATSVVLTWETAKAIGTAARDARIQRRSRNRRRSHQGGAADTRSPGRRQTRREISAGAGGAARADEDQSARHEFSRPAGKLGRARRQADAARLPELSGRKSIAPHAAVTSAIASRSTLNARARPDTMLGEMPTEGARARHAVERADEMPRHRMQPRAPRELVLDIGHHGFEHVLHRRVRRRLTEQARDRPRAAATAPDRPPGPASRHRHAPDVASASATPAIPPLMMMGTSGSAAFNR